MELKKEMTRNSIVGVTQLVLTSILTFVSIPIFIHQLGMELYGIFALVSVIGNLNAISNFGLNRALMVYISKQGKCDDSNRDIKVTLLWSTIIMLILTVIVIFFRIFIVTDVLKVPEPYTYQGAILLVCLMIANSILFIGQSYTAILDSLQKIRITNIIQFIYSLIYWGGLISAVLLGYQLISIGIISLISAFLWLLFVYIYAKREWGALGGFDFKDCFGATAKKLFTYGAKTYCATWLIFLYEPLSKILISNFCGVNLVGVYDIALKIKGVLTSLVGKAFYPLTPYLAACEESPLLHRRLWSITKFLTISSDIIAAAIILCMPFLLRVWLGSEYNQQVMIYVVWINVAYILFSPPSMPIFTYQGMRNMVEGNIITLAAQSAVNLIVFWGFLKLTPDYAIVLSNGAGIFVSYLICCHYQLKYGKIKLSHEYGFYTKQFIFVLLIAGTGILIYLNSVGSFAEMILYATILTILGLSFNKLFKMIRESDIEVLFDKGSAAYKVLMKWT